LTAALGLARSGAQSAKSVESITLFAASKNPAVSVEESLPKCAKGKNFPGDAHSQQVDAVDEVMRVTARA